MDKRIVLIACTIGCGAPLASPPPAPATATPQPPVEALPSPDDVDVPERPPPPIHTNPPAPERPPLPDVAEAWPPVELTAEPFQWTRDTKRLSETVDGAQIFRTGDGPRDCVIYNTEPEEPRLPGDLGPSTAVDCPPEMADPAFALCGVGTILQNGDVCGCARLGNPPPPSMVLSRCPVHGPGNAE